MSLQTSAYFEGKLFQGGFLSSWSTKAALAINSLVFVGLLAVLYRRWEQLPGYYLVLSAGLVIGSLMIWIRAWKEYSAIRSVLGGGNLEPADSSAGRIQRQLLRSAEALLHLASFYWVMGAFLAALAIDQATR
jgi:hypothetical protein